MRKHYILAAMAALATFTACSNDDEKEMNQNVPVHFNITSESITTRATTTASGNNYSTTFDNNDKIGIYTSGLVNEQGLTGNDMTNAQYTYNESTLTAADNSTQYYYPKTGEAKFYAYYPYSETAASSGVVSFGVQTDQSVEANFKKSDFMTCVKTQASTSQAITLSMSHRLALVEVVLTNMGGASVEINDVKTTATWTYATDAISTTESSTANVKMLQQNNSTTHWALVPAQAIAKGSKLFTITLSGNTYYYTITTDAGVTLASNKVNRFSLTRTVRGEIVTTSNVTGENWNGIENGESGEVEDKNYISSMPTTMESVTGFGSVNTSKPWCYHNSGLKDVSYSDGVFKATSIYQDKNSNYGVHWANSAIMHYDAEKLSGSQYVLSFTITSTSSTADSKVLVALFDNTKETPEGVGYYHPYQIIGSDGKYYQSKVEPAGSSKEISLTIDASKCYKVTGPNSTGNSDDTGTESATEKNWNSGFRLCLGLGSAEGGITYTISNLKLIKK